MGLWKDTILKMCIAVLVLLNIAVIPTSAMSLDDGQDDIFHFIGTDEYTGEYEPFTGSKPGIDIQTISFEIIEGKATLTMKLHGNAITGDSHIMYWLFYDSDEVNYSIWCSSDEDGTPFNLGIWNTPDLMGGMSSSVIMEGSEIVATFDIDIEGSNNINLTGFSYEYAEYDDDIIEFWMDVVPDDIDFGDDGTDDNETDDGTDGNETGNGTDDTNYSIYTVCPDGCNYTSIQTAIDAADSGDLIIVESGIYYENVNVNKQLTLHGTDTDTGMPVVDAEGNGTAINLSANGITLEGFIVTSNNTSLESNGIEINSNSNTITGNIINNYSNGIFIVESENNTIADNNASHNGCGIYLQNSNNNTIAGNSVSYNELGNILLYNSSSNRIYLNNFFINEINVQSDNSTNFWNSTEPINYTYNDTNSTGYLGNYWSDYTGNDTDGNGIGDTCYNISMDNDTVNIENPDDFPLMVPFGNYLNKLPIANFTYSPEEPVVNGTVTFNASSSYDIDGEIVSYVWDFGDGNITSTVDPVTDHVFTIAQNYTIELTVADDDEAEHCASQTIIVSDIE